MSVATPSESGLREEVWLSLVSVLRSYAALALVKDGIGITVSAAGPCEAILSSERAQFTIALEPDGRGRAVIATENRVTSESSFEIEEDGTLTRDGVTTELDLAAIEWVEMLVALERKAESGKAR